MKKNLYITIITFILLSILETIINQLFLKSSYNALQTVWRPNEELIANAPIFFLIYGVFAVSFTYLFNKAYNKTGIVDGISIGLAIGFMAKFWYGYTNYIVLPIPNALAFQWFFYGTIECMIIGAAAALVADKTE
jgi:hypothetical protein